MVDFTQFRRSVVAPGLRLIGHWSPAAENLVFGTAVQESNLTYLRQLGGGPALGFYQIEPATHTDLWENYLEYRPLMAEELEAFMIPAMDRDLQLITNLIYATAVCRLIYYRVPEPLPDADDIDGLGEYWKKHYNTHLGHGTAAQWALKYRAAHKGEK